VYYLSFSITTISSLRPSEGTLSQPHIIPIPIIIHSLSTSTLSSPPLATSGGPWARVGLLRGELSSPAGAVAQAEQELELARPLPSGPTGKTVREERVRWLCVEGKGGRVAGGPSVPPSTSPTSSLPERKFEKSGGRRRRAFWIPRIPHEPTKPPR
jgi:hypothetical protein